MGAICYSRLAFKKLDMEVVLNATLAGGVAIGASADVVNSPGLAILIGLLGGFISAVGFKKWNAWLCDKINLHDTCGVQFLHGIPGIFGALVSAIMVATMEA